MKTLEEVRKIKNNFHEEYSDIMKYFGNHLSTGIGKNASTGEFIIAARLINDKMKTYLPKVYQDVKVDLQVTGIAVAQK